MKDSSPKPAKPTYKVQLEFTPTAQNPDPNASLARLLKASKRAYGFQCVNIKDLPLADSPPAK